MLSVLWNAILPLVKFVLGLSLMMTIWLGLMLVAAFICKMIGDDR